MEFFEHLSANKTKSGAGNLIFLSNESIRRFRFSRSAALASLNCQIPTGVSYCRPTSVGSSQDVLHFLKLAERHLSLPFVWADQIDHNASKDAFLKCVASLGALTVSRSKNIQGMADIAESAVMDAYSFQGPEASLSTVMDQLEHYASPQRHGSFVSGLAMSESPIVKASIDYLMGGLLILKDAETLFMKKDFDPITPSALIVNDIITVAGGYTNSDRFVQSFMDLASTMGHSLVLVDHENIPSHYKSMLDHVELSDSSQLVAA